MSGVGVYEMLCLSRSCVTLKDTYLKPCRNAQDMREEPLGDYRERMLRVLAHKQNLDGPLSLEELAGGAFLPISFPPQFFVV